MYVCMYVCMILGTCVQVGDTFSYLYVCMYACMYPYYLALMYRCEAHSCIHGSFVKTDGEYLCMQVYMYVCIILGTYVQVGGTFSYSG